MPTVAQIKQRARQYRAHKMWYRSLSTRASVSVILDEHPDLGTALLMIQRAHFPGDLWSGHMAFPGGKHEVEDAHITETALRESYEELGISADSVQRIGRLSDILARPYRLQQKPMVVSPLLFEAKQKLNPSPNEEVADVLWVPLAHFLDKKNRQTMRWKHGGDEMTVPCHYYQDKKIWGISLIMIDEITQQLC